VCIAAPRCFNQFFHNMLIPNPAYPIHPYGFVIAGADIQHVPCGPEDDFFAELDR
jgi:alanine-synthesizing transaminase